MGACWLSGPSHLVQSQQLPARPSTSTSLRCVCCFTWIPGVAGGTASGKTTVVEAVTQRLRDSCVVMISQDSFYRALTPEESARANAGGEARPGGGGGRAGKGVPRAGRAGLDIRRVEC